MPIIFVTSAGPGSGKTGVAAAVARHYAYQGVPTKLIRFTGEGNAQTDAAFFASQFFVPGSPGQPQDPASYTSPASPDLDVVEGSPGDVPEGARVVLVSAGTPGETPEGLQPAVQVVTRVARQDLGTMPATQGDTPVCAIVEDRTLAGFSVEDVKRALFAEVLVDVEPQDTTCDHLVVAPIGSDAGQPYFRRFQRAAVVARYDKTDMHLAALRGEPVVLVLTGGRNPSEYTYDASRAAGVPLLLSRTDTENTIIALEGIFDETRFEGQAKLDRMAELIESANPFDALAIETAAAQGA